jgi:ATP-dependent exoDNAse (exonuclease V) beta subunit
VRDQDAKQYIPDVFKNMLCLTVYEAKGLEFDDVILYNFFHLGDVQKSQWKLLNDIELEEVQRVKIREALLMDFDCLDAEKSRMEELMKELKK